MRIPVTDRPFMLGVAHQGKNPQQMLDIGLKWARPAHTPYPYAPDGSLSEDYVAYRAELRRLHEAGMEVLSISPQPNQFIQAGIMPTGEDALRRVREVCRFVARLADRQRAVLRLLPLSPERRRGLRLHHPVHVGNAGGQSRRPAGPQQPG